MPIKPENRDRYPENWSEIRERILERDHHQCKICGAPNHEIISRYRDGDKNRYIKPDGATFDADTGDMLGYTRGSETPIGAYFVRVVLTISHKDHTPENCADDNLRALCQRCHLNYDRPHHKRERRKKPGQLSLNLGGEK